MNKLRQDPTSGDWVIIAPGRAKRPDESQEKKKSITPVPKKGCPFEDLTASGNTPTLAVYPNEKNWKIAVIPNKYPALEHSEGCAISFHHGLYFSKTGVGEHELIITRDHNKGFRDLSPATAVEVMKVFQSRHQRTAKEPCLLYATTFCNWGPSVGGSVWHPHYQFLATPFIPPHAARSLQGAESYFKKHHRCVRCDIIKQEQKERVRVIAENKFAIAIAPYAARRPYEVRIVPKQHLPYFHKTPEKTLAGVALLLQSVLQRLKKYVHNPDLNFFIHDAPLDGKEYPYHHWHIEVVPSVSRLGGFEFSTSIYINVVDPDVAAKVLRGEKTK